MRSSSSNPLNGTVLLALVCVSLFGVRLVRADDPIDFDQARQLLQRENRGEKLSKAEQSYLDRAKQEYRKRNPQPQPNRPATWSGHLTPLTELGKEQYKGQSGGLYGDGNNEPPKTHREESLRIAKQIQPLDRNGRPSTDGRIGFMSVGMSNTTQEFSTFMRLTEDDRQRSSSIVLVDGAQGGMPASGWADSQSRVWSELDNRLRNAGVTAAQIQVIWLKQAEAGPARYGEFPKHADQLQESLLQGLVNLKQKFPNLQLAYLSSRIYAGYASTQLNPEPYAYEGAFAVRDLIQQQISGEPDLNWNPDKGTVRAPLLLWGPYLWADGKTPRKSDQLTYQPEDFAGDGTHPSDNGRRKVAEQLDAFLKSDPSAKSWYLAPDRAR